MPEITIISPDGSQEIPEPESKYQKLLGRFAHENLQSQIRWEARRLGRDLFIATDRDGLIAVGLPQEHKVTAAEPGEVLLSRSHARHRVHSDVKTLSVGQTYTFYIDPASNVILEAKVAQEPFEVRSERSDSYPVDIDDLASVNPEEAVAFFSRLRRQPHIPFQYPENGCWARAHEMCRLIERHLDDDPRDVVAKVWNFGNLDVKTDNTPECRAQWWYHVAPVVKVNGERIVLDPSLFEQPVPLPKWQLAQSTTPARLDFTSLPAYEPDKDRPGNFYKALPGATEADLNNHRLLLAGQIYKHGPLPYACCRK